ncbi:MAG TPA: cyclic nucleotide-binding domain-containing protein [Opitutaceae bacterium]|nr:cyclic nucleotide-binding domain-containing protein [Opitutaceae bacterium]
MDEQLVLTAQTLRLNPDLQRADAPGNVFVIKNVPARKYLTVSAEQWNLLRNFANPANVPDVLRAVILNRTCLPLREFYELILKAFHAGILEISREGEPRSRVAAWPISLTPWVPIVLTAFSLGAAIALLATQPFPRPTGSLSDWVTSLLIGWALLCLGLSLGQAMAASVLRAGGGEIYEPKLRLLRPAPYFAVGLDDACMTSRLTQAGIWCARLFPVIATAAALWYYRPEFGLFHVLGVIVMLRPIANGCIPELISTVCRGLVLDTQKNFVFSLNRRWRVRVKISLSRLSWGYLLCRLAWGLIWILLVIFIGLRAAHQDVRDLFGNVGYWREVGLVFGIFAGAILLAYVGLPMTRFFWTRTANGGTRMVTKWGRWRINTKEPASEEHISRTLAESLLFRRISPVERDELRQSGEVRVFKSYKTLQDFQDKRDTVGIILSGRVVVYRRTKAGRAEKALTLLEGDIFGAHALLDAERQHARIRTATPVVALMIPLMEFENRVLRQLGAPLVNDLAQKVPFLRGVSFCHSWHPQAIARFAQLSSIVVFHEGELIVSEKQDTQQFYLVYEGHVAVKRRKHFRTNLKPGAFFGEVSILQNSSAMSDVVAREATRCLMISKADFLRFVTHNPLVSLQLEDISSKRLGRPIFPLSAHSFEVI